MNVKDSVRKKYLFVVKPGNSGRQLHAQAMHGRKMIDLNIFSHQFLKNEP
jgi:hypothetical protein